MSVEDIFVKKLNELKSMADIAHFRWLALYRDRDWLVDQEKRLAMLQARQDYQDAVASYVFLIKARKPRKQK